MPQPPLRQAPSPTFAYPENCWLVCKSRRGRRNVRELANFVRRAVALSRCGEIGIEALDHGKNRHGQTQRPAPPRSPEWKAGLSLGEMERQLFVMTLESTGGNRARAAELLGVSLRTVRNKIREFGLPPRNNYRNQLCSTDLRSTDLANNNSRNSPNSKEQPCP